MAIKKYSLQTREEPEGNTNLMTSIKRKLSGKSGQAGENQLPTSERNLILIRRISSSE